MKRRKSAVSFTNNVVLLCFDHRPMRINLLIAISLQTCHTFFPAVDLVLFSLLFQVWQNVSIKRRTVAKLQFHLLPCIFSRDVSKEMSIGKMLKFRITNQYASF